MSLLNLKSVFQDQLESNVESFKSNQPIDKTDTRLNYNDISTNKQTFTTVVDLTQRGGKDNPMLDALLRGRVYEPIRFSQDFQNNNLFVKPEIPPFEVSLFREQTFDPRASFPKEGTLYFNTNKSFSPVMNPTDFSTAAGIDDLPYTPITSLGGQFKDNLSWENLYEANHSPKDNPTYKGKPIISYGPNVNRDKLNIRNPEDGVFGFSNALRTSSISAIGKLIGEIPIIGYIPIVSNIQDAVSNFLQDTGKEPYIVSKIPRIGDSGFNGRRTNSNFLDRGLPIQRSITDVFRIGKFLTSPAGVSFFAKQNALGLQGQKYKSSYNLFSTLIATGGRAGGGPAVLIDRTTPDILNIFNQTEYPNFDPNAEPGTLEISSGTDVLRAVGQIGGGIISGGGIGGLSIQDFGQGSPMAVQYLIDKEFGGNPAVRGLDFNLSDTDKPRFGPLRSQTISLNTIVPELSDSAIAFSNDLKSKAGEKLAEIGEKVAETAKKYATGLRARFKAKETPSFKLEEDGTLTPKLDLPGVGDGFNPLAGLKINNSYADASMRHYRGPESGLMTREQKLNANIRFEMSGNSTSANPTTDIYQLLGLSQKKILDPTASTAASNIANKAVSSMADAPGAIAGAAGGTLAGTKAGFKASVAAGINTVKDGVGSLAGQTVGKLTDRFKRTTDEEYPDFDPNVDGESPLQKESTIENKVQNYIDSTTGLYKLHDTFVDALGKGDVGGTSTYPDNNTGDLFTNLPFYDNINNLTLKDSYGEYGVEKIESGGSGMPFYFKDMRTNAYIFFRAYIEGLTENISPAYAVHNYIGRSEPVYTYERGEREISMTLKLFAQTGGELKSIYQKMDRLTSLCYPQYELDEYGNRMKPPFTRFRYGELFGKMNKELMGYIKSISYSYEQSSPYEVLPGQRVPKHIVATIGYQVIHDKTPSIDTKFYGINNY